LESVEYWKGMEPLLTPRYLLEFTTERQLAISQLQRM
jgi:hypothetical protein